MSLKKGTQECPTTNFVFKDIGIVCPTETFLSLFSASLEQQERRVVFRCSLVGDFQRLPRLAPLRTDGPPSGGEPTAPLPRWRIPPAAFASHSSGGPVSHGIRVLPDWTASQQQCSRALGRDGVHRGHQRTPWPDAPVLEPGAGRQTKVQRDPSVLAAQVRWLLSRLSIWQEWKDKNATNVSS